MTLGVLVALLRVFVACDGCDAAGFKNDVPFVEFVIDRAQAEVEVAINSTINDTSQRVWRLAFTGRGTFAGQDRSLAVTLDPALPADEARTRLARVLKFGLAEYAFRSDAGPQLDVTLRPEDQAKPPTAAQQDPWNYWIYRFSVDGYQNGEVSSSSRSFSGGASASRVTEAWKMNFSAYASQNSSRFEVSDTQTVLTDESDWNVDSLVVKSLNGHWSLGARGGVSASTYSNFKLRQSIEPAIEFDVFPYSESSERSLTIQYAVGPSHYEYHQLTIYDKLQETVWRQSVTASLGFRQPWGSAGASASFAHLIPDTSQNRVSVFGNVSIRLFRGFSVNGSAGFSRIRDQFYLEKADATPEEILLRLRQLATGFSYNASFGISYSFGSLSNATVNPRFGG